MRPYRPNENITIDSFRVRIPIDRVKVIDNELNQEIIKVNKETGELIETDIPQSKKYEINGIKTKFQITNLRISNTQSKTFLSIQISSKHLESEYFTGITTENIQKVYESIISLNIVSFDYDLFLESQISDVDFKKDVLLSQEYYKNHISDVVRIAKAYKEYSKGYQQYDNKTNQGIQFSSRNTGTPTHPFLKIYNKDRQLTKMNEFVSVYYPEINITDLTKSTENLFRIEFTIKNKKHFDRYDITDLSLSNILSIKQSELQNMLSDIWTLHTDKDYLHNTETDSDRFTIQDVYEILIPDLLKQGKPISQILNKVTDRIPNNKTRSSHKKMIMNVYNRVINNDTTNSIKNTNEFYQKIGINSKIEI